MPLPSKPQGKTTGSTNRRTKLEFPKSVLEYLERRRMRREEIMSNPCFMHWGLDVETDEDGYLYAYEVPVYES